MKDELSFRGWQISLQLKLLKFAKKIFFLVLEFIQLSFLSSEIDVKTVPVSLIFFFVVGKRFFFFFFFFFFIKALTKTLKNSIYQTKQFDNFSFLANEI